MSTHQLRVARVRGKALWQQARADALELAGAAARRLDRAPVRGRADRTRRMAPLLEAFAQVRASGFFVQIGANDDRERDPLRRLLVGQGWAGIVVEPIPQSLDWARLSYGAAVNIAFEPAAVAETDGECRFYYVGRGDGSERAGVPLPSGSLRREALLFHRRFTPEFEDPVLEIMTPCLSFEALCARHDVASIDVLALDTEGADHLLLEQFNFDRFRPALLALESAHLTLAARSSSVERLRRFGYDTLEHQNDIWAMCPAALSPDEASILCPLWRWTAERYDPGKPLWMTAWLRKTARSAMGRSAPTRDGAGELFRLSASERRYLERGYDDRTPLPADASSYLSAQNPRLEQLRRSYRALDVPAVEHHMWRATRVAEAVDLRYFRGDNLYLWHYPEHPRAMALSLFVYLRYVEERGAAELLRRLSEDGSFGCWTAEISGYGKVSRDLLDSINDILFLDRQLGVLASDGLRVLDIGAGYGRLAHRLCSALSSLADYCCVDAVAESTFLAEYYLSFRGCTPPAQVLELGQVGSLAPGSFDLALNIHSFSECTLAAIEWWMAQLGRLEVPNLLVVPNEPEGIVSREQDGSFHDAMPVIEAAGYRVAACERVIADPAVRDLIQINDNFYLFELAK